MSPMGRRGAVLTQVIVIGLYSVSSIFLVSVKMFRTMSFGCLPEKSVLSFLSFSFSLGFLVSAHVPGHSRALFS